MPYFAHLDESLKFLGVENPKLLMEDEWRWRNDWYGFAKRAFSGFSDTTYLLFGGRSGLEANMILRGSPTATVFIVEPDKNRRRFLTNKFAYEPRAKILEKFSTVDCMVERFDLVRIDHTFLLQVQFDLATLLDELFYRANAGVYQLCGTFRSDEIDPLRLYRASQQVKGWFFWRDEIDGLGFSGRPATDVYEVSVVVPAYKIVDQIDQCLSSLVNQTLRRIEIIVVDDGSPDETGTKADEWAARFPGRVRVIHKPNGGCASARAAGLRAARGTFVGFVDGDDWVDVHMYEELLRAALLTGMDIAECGYALAFADGSLEHHDPVSRGRIGVYGIGVIEDPLILTETQPTIWRRIYNRAFLEAMDIQFPEHIRRFDDLPFQFEALTSVRAVATIGGCFYFYRQGRLGQDIEIRDERLFVHMDIFDWLKDRILSWGSAEHEKRLLKVELNTHLWALARLDRPLAKRYWREAGDQLIAQRTNLRRIDMVRFAARHSFRSLLLIGTAAARDVLRREHNSKFHVRPSGG